MSVKKLGLGQVDFNQENTEGPRVVAVHSWGRGILTGERKEAFIASSAVKKVHEVLKKLPREVIVEEDPLEIL